MKKIIIITLLFCSTFVGQAYTQAKRSVIKSDIIENVDGRSFIIHFVKKGQQLSDLLNVYNVTIDELKRYNKGIKDRLHPNSILKIPIKPKTTFAKPIAKPITKEIKSKSSNYNGSSENIGKHIVKTKETLYSISKLYNISVNDIKIANPNLNEKLSIGEELTIIKKEVKPIEYNYTAKPKETLYSISKANGVSIEQLIKANPSLKDGLKIDQQLIIPKIVQPEPYGNLILNSVGSEDTIHLNIYHRIKRKETVFSIAKKYDITMGEVYLRNPEIKLNGLKTGNLINIPIVKPVFEGYYVIQSDRVQRDTMIHFVNHKVQRKQKLADIAEIYGIEVSSIQWLNPNVKNKPSRRRPVKIPVTKRKIEIIPEEIEEVIEDEEVIADIEYYCSNDEPNKIWKIAIMLPFQIESFVEVGEEKILQGGKDRVKAFNFIQYYEGALLAIDSLKNLGLNIEVFVYDVDKDPAKAVALLNEEIQQMDLIFGPVYRTTFNIISDYAERYEIPMINPLSKSAEVFENRSNVFKVQSPVWSNLDAMSDYILNNIHDSTNIVIVRHNEYQNVDRVEYLTSKLEEQLLENEIYIQESIYLDDDFEGFVEKTFPDQENIIINVSDDEVFVIDMMRQMHELCDSLPYVLYGMPSWTRFNMETSYLLDLNVHQFDNSHVDYNRWDVDEFVYKFYQAYGAGPEPRKYAFLGFDVTYYFLDALRKYGKDFKNCLQYHEYNGLESVFDFKEMPSGSYQNTGVYGYRYEDYQIIRIK